MPHLNSDSNKRGSNKNRLASHEESSSSDIATAFDEGSPKNFNKRTIYVNVTSSLNEQSKLTISLNLEIFTTIRQKLVYSLLRQEDESHHGIPIKARSLYKQYSHGGAITNNCDKQTPEPANLQLA